MHKTQKYLLKNTLNILYNALCLNHENSNLAIYCGKNLLLKDYRSNRHYIISWKVFNPLNQNITHIENKLRKNCVFLSLHFFLHLIKHYHLNRLMGITYSVHTFLNKKIFNVLKQNLSIKNLMILTIHMISLTLGI